MPLVTFICTKLHLKKELDTQMIYPFQGVTILIITASERSSKEL